MFPLFRSFLFVWFGFVLVLFLFLRTANFVNGNILTNSRVKKVSLVWFALYKFIPRHSCILDSDPAVTTWCYGARIYAN